MTIWTMFAAVALVTWAISLALGLSLVTAPGKAQSAARSRAASTHSWIV